MSKQDIIKKLNQKKVKDFLNAYGIQWLSLFGSYARDEAKKDSDIDLIYTQKKDSKMGLEFFDVLAFLEKLLNKKVDMVEKSHINKSLKPYILTDKIDII